MRSSRVLALCLGLFAANAGAQSTTDYDDDNDNLIDIRTLAQLNAVRYDLDGNGTVSATDRTAYTAAFTTPATGMGCASTCTGYELRQNLDFDTDNDNDVDSNDAYPNWSPIGGSYSATFEGNGYTISRLTVVNATGHAGLFNAVSGTVRNLGVADANVSSVGGSTTNVGPIAGELTGTVISSWASGQSRAGPGSSSRPRVGGLVGRVASGGRLAASYSTVSVTGSGKSSTYSGGLAGGVFRGTIVACYATGAVNGGGSSYAGGLFGGNAGPSTVRASYFAGTVTNGAAFGVTGENDGSNEKYYDVYFDTDTTSLSGDAGRTTASLQRPTDASGIYANWDDMDVNGNGTADEDPWHFGQSNQYPVLNYGTLSAATQFAEQLAGQTDTAPSYSGISVSDKDFRRGIAIGSFVIPPPTGGNGTYDYTVSGLPTGLVFDEDGTGTCMAARTVCGTPSVVGAVTVTVTVADADTNIAATDRATLTFSVAVTEGRLIVSPSRLSLAEGASSTYTVVLSIAPTGPVTVGVSSDNPAVTVGASSLTFTMQNWNTAQSVTVTAEGDADAVDEAATITNAASGGSYSASGFVRVGVADDEPSAGTDYDADNDGLIDVDSLAKLNAMRWDVDGDGTPSSGNAADYTAAFPGAGAGMGCPDGPDANQLADTCGGYALTADLDFDTDDDGDVDADDAFASWTPIVGWATTFDGRGHVISNLTVTGSGDDRGLFATATTNATVRALGLLDVSVTGPGVRLAALAGVFNGRVAAVYATGVVRGAGGVAGLVAETQSTSARIVASYSTVAVECTNTAGWARAGGLAARNDGTITTSYAAGAVTGDCPATVKGGLVSLNNGTVTASYWDAGLTGITDDGDTSPEDLSSSAMWTPTAYGASAFDVYNAWDDQDVDGDGAVDTDPWDFGTALNHPVLKWGGLDPADQRTDYDADGDRLVEISTLAQLDAVRWDLDGDGAPSSGNESGYFGAFFNPVFNPSGVGFCAPTTDDADDNDCLGYELLNDLDFDTDGSGSTHTNGAGDSDDAYYNADDGWVPIGPNVTPGAATHYRARFDGNGHVIDNLFVKRNRNYSGLFAALSDAALVTSLGLPDAYVGDGQGTVGMLAGANRGRVAAVWSSGSVTAITNVGGLVGAAQAISTVVASYSTATVVCTGSGPWRAAGGLVGTNGASSTIATSYSTGTVTGPNCQLLRAFAYNDGTVAASYWDTTLSGIMDDTEDPPQPPEGRTTAVLQAPTDYDTLVGDPDEAIYAAWDDQDVDGDGATGDGDDADPWDFGPSNQHPILKYRGLAAAPQLDAQPDTAPMFATSTAGGLTFQKDVAIQAFQVPAATGGNGVLSYEQNGLPTGLVFDADGTGSCPGNAPRAVCGTPTATTTAPVTVTITVRDADGTVGATDEGELTFTVEVVVPSASIASPGALAEASLHNATVTVALANTTFEGGVPAGSFALAIDPPLAGLSVGSVAPVNVGDTSAVLTLSYTGGNFDTVRTLSVTVPDSAHALVGALTTPTANIVPTPSVAVSRTNLALTEGGASSTYAVVLGGQPTGTVTVRATSSDTDVARVEHGHRDAGLAEHADVHAAELEHGAGGDGGAPGRRRRGERVGDDQPRGVAELRRDGGERGRDGGGRRDGGDRDRRGSGHGERRGRRSGGADGGRGDEHAVHGEAVVAADGHGDGDGDEHRRGRRDGGHGRGDGPAERTDVHHEQLGHGADGVADAGGRRRSEQRGGGDPALGVERRLRRRGGAAAGDGGGQRRGRGRGHGPGHARRPADGAGAERRADADVHGAPFDPADGRHRGGDGVERQPGHRHRGGNVRRNLRQRGEPAVQHAELGHGADGAGAPRAGRGPGGRAGDDLAQPGRQRPVRRRRHDRHRRHDAGRRGDGDGPRRGRRQPDRDRLAGEAERGALGPGRRRDALGLDIDLPVRVRGFRAGGGHGLPGRPGPGPGGRLRRLRAHGGPGLRHGRRRRRGRGRRLPQLGAHRRRLQRHLPRQQPRDLQPDHERRRRTGVLLWTGGQQPRVEPGPDRRRRDGDQRRQRRFPRRGRLGRKQ